ncbi:pyridoxamine kinase [Oscillospiraceae bacterium CM]|nr:pyridoxamine kinase [Oscillospiraceae bacterium CM]
MPRQKRVAAIHDISCFGKCSLTVALPIISSAGVEVSVIPTAVLSTHTGGFTDYTYRDLTDDILPIARHWQSLHVRFDAVYTGFLGSFAQLGIVSDVCEMLKSAGTLIVVDPVMADNGMLYAGFSDDFPAGMQTLCRKADVLVPNMTEAFLLLGEPFTPGPYNVSMIERLLYGLGALGPKHVVLTGVYFDALKLGAACFDTASGQIDYCFAERIDGFYHGTGDVFASTLTAGLLTEHSLASAAQIAVDFTVESISRTKKAGTDVRFGVNFEAGLPSLSQRLLR